MNSTKTNHLAFLSLAISVGTMAGVLLMFLDMKESNKALASLVVSANQTESAPANIDELVLAALEAKEKAEQDEFIKTRLAPYQAADPNSRLYGNPDARFRLIEASDMNCPYCGQFHSTPKQLVDNLPDLLSWDYRHMPLQGKGQSSVDAAVLAECLMQTHGSAVMHSYISAVFESGGARSTSNVTNIAKQYGYDAAQCDQAAARETVQTHLQQANQAGATGTPANWLVDRQTGEMVPIHGAQSADTFVQAMQAFIDKTNSTTN